MNLHQHQHREQRNLELNSEKKNCPHWYPPLYLHISLRRSLSFCRLLSSGAGSSLNSEVNWLIGTVQLGALSCEHLTVPCVSPWLLRSTAHNWAFLCCEWSLPIISLLLPSDPKLTAIPTACTSSSCCSEPTEVAQPGFGQSILFSSLLEWRTRAI